MITEVFTEMLLDYGDTQSLPPLTDFVDLPDPLDPSRHEPAEPSDPTDSPVPASELVNEPMGKPVGGLGNAAARGTGITLAMQGVRFVLQFCSLVVLARLLTPADFGIVYWLLGGLAAAAVLAWVLDWARVWILSHASECITADLRLETYSHLQRLSLEYFGGKRTGDLISRISNDSPAANTTSRPNKRGSQSQCTFTPRPNAMLAATPP